VIGMRALWVIGLRGIRIRPTAPGSQRFLHRPPVVCANQNRIAGEGFRYEVIEEGEAHVKTVSNL